jgi:hypothetical protein
MYVARRPCTACALVRLAVRRCRLRSARGRPRLPRRRSPPFRVHARTLSRRPVVALTTTRAAPLLPLPLLLMQEQQLLQLLLLHLLPPPRRHAPASDAGRTLQSADVTSLRVGGASRATREDLAGRSPQNGAAAATSPCRTCRPSPRARCAPVSCAARFWSRIAIRSVVVCRGVGSPPAGEAARARAGSEAGSGRATHAIPR